MKKKENFHCLILLRFLAPLSHFSEPTEFQPKKNLFLPVNQKSLRKKKQRKLFQVIII